MSNTFETEMEIVEHFEHCVETYLDQHDFNRWLRQHDAEVAKATEERIIKLLEGCLQDEEWHIRNVMCCGDIPCRKNWLDTIINTDGNTARQGVIALIKGEK